MTDVAPMPVRAPFFRRLWVVVLMTCLLIPMPIAMIVLLTGPVYRRKPDGYRGKLAVSGDSHAEKRKAVERRSSGEVG